MNESIPAIYTAGVFRPLQPVELAEGTHVEVQVAGHAVADDHDLSVSDNMDDATRKAWCDYLDRIESLPDASPKDGLSNRDHDRIIYGD